jgi:hypothetical protein
LSCALRGLLYEVKSIQREGKRKEREMSMISDQIEEYKTCPRDLLCVASERERDCCSGIHVRSHEAVERASNRHSFIHQFLPSSTHPLPPSLFGI